MILVPAVLCVEKHISVNLGLQDFIFQKKVKSAISLTPLWVT